jgi:hypothetical protein
MEVNIVVVVYKCHLSEKVGAVCVQILQVQLHTAVAAKTKTALAPAAALTFSSVLREALLAMSTLERPEAQLIKLGMSLLIEACSLSGYSRLHSLSYLR